VNGALDLGAYEFAPLTSRCDINSDAAVNVLDVQSLINIVLGGSGSGDLNGDGRVDSLDVQLLVNVVLGSSTCPS
jgi:hypothetical protein